MFQSLKKSLDHSLKMLSNKVLILAATAAIANAAYDTYPSVAHTASINGFADKIYADLPSCAQACVKEDTGSTPCPYWDTGCLCVMSVWGNEVAECIASACSGNDVVAATSLGQSICSSAGAGSWFLAATDVALLEAAASATATEETSAVATTSAQTAEVSSSSVATSTPAEETTSSNAGPEATSFVGSTEATSATLITSAAESSDALAESAEESSPSSSSSAAPAESSAASVEVANGAYNNFPGVVGMMGSALVGMILCF